MLSNFFPHNPSSSRARRAKQQKEATEFNSRLSYQVRTNLTSVIGLAENMLDEKPKPVNPDNLSKIIDNGKELLGYVSALAEDAPIKAKKFSGPIPEFFTGRILLVEDNKVNCQVITEVLERSGLQVTACSDGVQALELIKVAKFDLIVVDMVLPLLDGAATIKAMRAHGYKNSILAVSANVTKSGVGQCFKAGANDFVPKPIERGNFLHLVSRHLDNSPRLEAV